MLVHIRPSHNWFTFRASSCFEELAFIPDLCRVPSWNRQVPRAPLPSSGVTFTRIVSSTISKRVTSSSSLSRAHAPTQNPLTGFGFPPPMSLRRLLPAPAGRWAFPTLSPQSLHRCLDPYPAVFSSCTYPFLPKKQRLHIRSHMFSTLSSTCHATSTGN